MMGLGGGLLLLGAATQVAGYQLDTSTLAMQLSAKAVKSNETSALRTLFGQPWTLNTSIWMQGDANSLDCPNERGAVPVSEDECRAIALMTPGQGSMLNPVWPVDVDFMPPGCSMSIQMGTSTMMTWNINAGGPSPAFVVACKEPLYDLYAGGQCPTGMVTISETECHEAAIAFHYDYDVNIQPIHAPHMATGCFGKDGDMHFSTHPTGTPGDMDSFNLCKFPTGTSTTGAYTTTTTGGGNVGATGDPHMTTILGNRFDIVRAGNYTFLHIPQHAPMDDSLLTVKATVRHEGVACLDMYIDELNFTGHWVDDRSYGGLRFFATEGLEGPGEWMTFGQLDLKVVHGKTAGGVRYLNVLARHLKKVRYPIGGILGLDDFTHAATPEEDCKKKMTLISLLSSK